MFFHVAVNVAPGAVTTGLAAMLGPEAVTVTLLLVPRSRVVSLANILASYVPGGSEFGSTKEIVPSLWPVAQTHATKPPLPAPVGNSATQSFVVGVPTDCQVTDTVPP